MSRLTAREGLAERLWRAVVDFLAAALYVDDTELFTAFLVWTAGILEARHVAAHALVAGLDALAGRLRDFPRTVHLIREGTAALGERSVRPLPSPGTPA